MDSNTFLSRQPVFDTNEITVFYDLFYLDHDLQSDFIDDRYATASVLTTVLNKLGVKTVAGDHSVFIKADESFLMHDLIYSIPKAQFIIAILEYVELSESVIKRIEDLSSKGYRIALNDIALTQDNLNKFAPILNNINFIKVDVIRTGEKLLQANYHLLEALNAQTVASKLETREEFELCKSLGFNYFQGYYFAKPIIVNNASLDVQQLSVLRLTSLLMSDVDLDEIVVEFEKNYALTVQLLKFINSGAFHFREKLTSIKHILALLGRQQLSQWLMLMIYAKSIVTSPSMESPLLLMVKNRTELMTKLLLTIVPSADKEYQSEAYFVAVLSLADTLFGVSKETILTELNVDEKVRDALLYRKGTLGELYALLRDIEMINTASVEAFIKKYNLDSDTITHIASESMSNVNELEASLKFDAMAAD